MAQHKITFIAKSEPNTKLVEEQLAGLDYELQVRICDSEGETIEAVKGADLIIDRQVPLPRSVIQEIDKAKAIVNLGHGFDRIDHNAATDHNVMVVNSAGFCTEEVSNHTIMLLLACAKELSQLNSVVKAGQWGPDIRPSLSRLVPIDGQTLGLIGFGNIARATARKAKVFGLEVIAYDPYVQPWLFKEYRVEIVASLEELARRSDFVSMHVPLNDKTSKLADGAFFKAMKPTAYFINTCRGPTVDEQALIGALQRGELAGAGLDVFEVEPTPADNPLLAMDNVVVTPHSAGSSSTAWVTADIQMGQEAARILRGTWPMSLVNPEVRSKIPARPGGVNR